MDLTVACEHSHSEGIWLNRTDLTGILVLAVFGGSLFTFSILITLKKFEFIHGCKWRWATPVHTEQRLYFALQRMINERPRDAHYDDRTLGLNADKHRLQQLLADEGDANLADMEVVRLNSHHSNSKTPRASVKQNSHQGGPDFSQGVVFVFTDLEGSTPMAEFDPVTFDYLLQVHDSIIRETLATEGGYEMNTQGDEFQLAFPSILPAVRFCMTLQQRLLSFEWPRSVLRMPFCDSVKNCASNLTLLHGPRVRMGIHAPSLGHGSPDWDDPACGVQMKVHTLTKHVVFSGPEVELARAVADAAAGGQVLMTRPTWAALRRKQCVMDDPLVEHLGHYRLKSQQEVSLYQLHPSMASPMAKRHFGPEALRNVTYLKVGRGLNLTRPPFVKGSEDSNSNHRVMRNSFSRLHGLNLDQSHDSSGTVSRASPCQGSPDLSAHTDATQMRHSHSNSKSHNVVGGRVSESTRDLVVVVARFTHFSDQLKYAAGWAEYAGNGSRGFGEKAPRPRIVKRGTSMEEYTPPPYFEAVHSDPGIKAMFAVVEECLLETAQMFDGYMNVVEDIQPDFMLFFPTVHAAVRFTATAHVALMEADERLHISSAGIKMWRSLAPQETSLSGNLLFKGPRLAFFIDTVPESTVSVSSVEYEPEEVAVTSSGQNLLQRAFVGSMWDTLAGEDTLGRMETGEASVKRYGRDGRGGAGDVSVCRRRTVHDVSIRPSRADSTVVKGGLFTRKTSTNVLTEPDVGDQQQRLFDKFHMRGGDKMLTGLSLERVREVCHMAWGGQTVLSDNAWVCVQTTLPVGLQVISLGTHEVSTFLGVLRGYFVEIMPDVLAAREFPPMPSKATITFGYREAPNPRPVPPSAKRRFSLRRPTPLAVNSQTGTAGNVRSFPFAGTIKTEDNVALVTCRVRPHKPRDIDSASEANECTQTNETLVQYTDLVRSLLMRFYGYECKEPDQGNFTLCFCRLEDALAYCVTLQSEMLALDWGINSLVVLHKGHGDALPMHMVCPVCIGIAHGSTVFRRPLQATGSADYFGPLANLTARVAGQAHQSQVLLESSSFSRQHVESIQAGQTVQLQHYGCNIHIKPGRMVKMKGIEEGKMLFSVQCDRIAEMRFPPPEGLVGPSAAVRSHWQSAVKLMQASKMLQNKAADTANTMASARIRESTFPQMRKSGSKDALSHSPSHSSDSRAHGGSHGSTLDHARHRLSTTERRASAFSHVNGLGDGDSVHLPGAVDSSL